jgi:hypothetical protein
VVTPVVPKLPVEPLLRQYPGETISAVEKQLELTKGRIQVWSRTGGIPLDDADEVACRANFHPSEIWGDDWWAAAEWVPSCPRGHIFSDENTYVDKRGHRSCRRCSRERRARRVAAIRARRDDVDGDVVGLAS